MSVEKIPQSERDAIKKELITVLTKEFGERIEKEIKKQLGSREREEDVKNLVADALVRLFKTLYNRQSFWSKSI